MEQLSLKDAIKESAKRVKKNKLIKKEVEGDSDSIEKLVIKTKLGKLFFDKNKHHEERYGLHASAIISTDAQFCFRQQVLSLFYKQKQGEQFSERLLRIFATGNQIHEKWQNMFKNAKIAYVIEGRSFSSKFDLLFTPDAIIEINKRRYVVEIKSMNTFSYKKATSHPSGEKQLMLYMYLLGIPHGFILIEDKNSQEFDVFLKTYDYKLVIPYIERLVQIRHMKHDYIKNKNLPTRKCKNCDIKRSIDCNMRDACWYIKKQRLNIQ